MLARSRVNGVSNTAIARASQRTNEELRHARFTFLVVGIGAATALRGEQCPPRAEPPDPERMATSGLPCRALCATTDRRPAAAAPSLHLLPLFPLALCTHTALETDGILALIDLPSQLQARASPGKRKYTKADHSPSSLHGFPQQGTKSTEQRRA